MNVLWVAVGGALGCACRYGATVALAGAVASVPLATLGVNLLGSLALGALVERAAADPRGSTAWLALLGTGFCGGFTTMSTFAVETLRLPLPNAAANVALHLGGCLGAAWVGARLVRVLQGAG